MAFHLVGARLTRALLAELEEQRQAEREVVLERYFDDLAAETVLEDTGSARIEGLPSRLAATAADGADGRMRES